MPSKPSQPDLKNKSASKFHPHNRHQGRYDFSRLILSNTALSGFIQTNEHGEQSIDFSNADAVKALNRALLIEQYNIKDWDIPQGNLCPPIPGRADYVHYLGDLLANSNEGKLPKGNHIHALDIGTGANCIYPLIGASEYNWNFVGSDISATSLSNAQTILDANPALAKKIKLRLQTDPDKIFNNVIGDDEWFDLTLCNPPFHSSLAEATEGTQRKWKNLERLDNNPGLNFGGQGNELWCAGGEEGFISRMIGESQQYATRCFWFTTLVSKSSSLPAIYSALSKSAVHMQQTFDMHQGQKKSRFVAWTFLTSAQQAGWRKTRWKNK